MAEQQPPEDAPLDEGDEVGEGETLMEAVGDAFRGSGVGTQDPNIVGNVGPLDIPPGEDDDWVVEGDEDDPGQVT